MAKTEATVTSAVKNWYIIFFSHSNRTWEMPIGAKTVKFSAKSEFFDYTVFRAPPRAQEKNKQNKKKCWFFWCPGGVA